MALTKISNLELLDCPDCVDLLENGQCGLLTDTPCKGYDCTFMRTRGDAATSIEKSRRRLGRLDEATQARIANKYYGGMRPWTCCME